MRYRIVWDSHSRRRAGQAAGWAMIRSGACAAARRGVVAWLVAGLVVAWKVEPAAAADCGLERRRLDEQHSDVISRFTAGSPAFFTAMSVLESRMFKLIDACRDDPLVYALMAELQLSLGQAPLAELYARKAYGMAQGLWQTEHVLGTSMARLGKYDGAIPHLERAVELAPANDALLLNLCTIYEIAGRYESAVDACGRLIDRGAPSLLGAAYHLRGKAYRGLEQMERAEADAARARALGFEASPGRDQARPEAGEQAGEKVGASPAR